MRERESARHCLVYHHHHTTLSNRAGHLHRQVVLAASAGLVRKQDALKVALAAANVEIKGLEALLVAVLPIAAAWCGHGDREPRRAQKGDGDHHQSLERHHHHHHHRRRRRRPGLQPIALSCSICTHRQSSHWACAPHRSIEDLEDPSFSFLLPAPFKRWPAKCPL